MYEQDLHAERARKFEMAQHQQDSDGDDTEVAKAEAVKVEVAKVEVLQGDGSTAEILSSDQPAQIRIHYNAFEPLGRVQASAFIIRSDGMTCCMMRTKLDNFELVVEPGSGVITLQVDPLQIVSGTYFVEAYLLNESDSMALNSKACRSDWFSVKGAALSYEESAGIFEPNTHWDHFSNGAVQIEAGTLAPTAFQLESIDPEFAVE